MVRAVGAIRTVVIVQVIVVQARIKPMRNKCARPGQNHLHQVAIGFKRRIHLIISQQETHFIISKCTNVILALQHFLHIHTSTQAGLSMLNDTSIVNIHKECIATSVKVNCSGA